MYYEPWNPIWKYLFSLKCHLMTSLSIICWQIQCSPVIYIFKVHFQDQTNLKRSSWWENIQTSMVYNPSAVRRTMQTFQDMPSLQCVSLSMTGQLQYLLKIQFLFHAVTFKPVQLLFLLCEKVSPSSERTNWVIQRAKPPSAFWDSSWTYSCFGSYKFSCARNLPQPLHGRVSKQKRKRKL